LKFKLFFLLRKQYYTNNFIIFYEIFIGGITCAYQPCRNGGTCYNLSNNAYACVCPSVYTGTNCESIVTSCKRIFECKSIKNFFCFVDCPLDCAPGYCVPSGGNMAPYVCNCNGILKLTNCVSK
jgi:hypothetical protein